MIFLAYIVLPMTLVALFFAEICGRVYDRDDIPGFVFIIAVAMTISTIILSIFGVLLWWSYIIPATTVIFIVSLLTGAIMVPYYLYNGKNVPKSWFFYENGIILTSSSTENHVYLEIYTEIKNIRGFKWKTY